MTVSTISLSLYKFSLQTYDIEKSITKEDFNVQPVYL